MHIMSSMQRFTQMHTLESIVHRQQASDSASRRLQQLPEDDIHSKDKRIHGTYCKGSACKGEELETVHTRGNPSGKVFPSTGK